MASCTRSVDPSVIAELAEELRYLLILHDKAATQLQIIGKTLKYILNFAFI